MWSQSTCHYQHMPEGTSAVILINGENVYRRQLTPTDTRLVLGPRAINATILECGKLRTDGNSV